MFYLSFKLISVILAVSHLQADSPDPTVSRGSLAASYSTMMAVEDRNGDGVEDVLVGDHMTGRLACLNGETGDPIWVSGERIPAGSLFFVWPDVTGDGLFEVVVGEWCGKQRLIDASSGLDLGKDQGPQLPLLWTEVFDEDLLACGVRVRPGDGGHDLVFMSYMPDEQGWNELCEVHTGLRRLSSLRAAVVHDALGERVFVYNKSGQGVVARSGEKERVLWGGGARGPL